MGKPGRAPQDMPRVQGTGCWDAADAGEESSQGLGVMAPLCFLGKGCGWHMPWHPHRHPDASHFPLLLWVGGFACKQQPLGNTSNPSLGYYSSPANLKASPFFSARHPQSRGNSSALT